MVNLILNNIEEDLLLNLKSDEETDNYVNHLLDM